ncbi:hypothetical protein ACROYT_G026892 [Oculina patagonica]
MVHLFRWKKSYVKTQSNRLKLQDVMMTFPALQFKAGWSKEQRMCQKKVKEVLEKMAVISLPIIMLPFKWIKPAV